MSTHPVVEHLRASSVESLQALGIYARWSEQNPRKVSLNYDQVEAVDGNVLVEHCRGLVLRQDHDGPRGAPGAYSVLARPMRRFYHLGSGHAAHIDWSTAEIEEKLDGTLCIVYYDPDLDSWCVATRSVPDADVPTPSGATFADLFWEHCEGAPVWARSWSGRTLCCELTGPGNQIVVPYHDWSVTVLADIDTATGEERPGDAPRHRFADIDEALAWLNDQPGHLHEGFVVRDAGGNRVKVKSAQYAAVARVMTTAGSAVGLVEIVLSGTADDVQPFLPRPRMAELGQVQRDVASWVRSLDLVASVLRGATEDRKTAAIAIQRDERLKPWIGAVLDVWGGKAPSIGAWLEARRPVQRSLAERVLAAIGGAP